VEDMTKPTIQEKIDQAYTESVETDRTLHPEPNSKQGCLRNSLEKLGNIDPIVIWDFNDITSMIVNGRKRFQCALPEMKKTLLKGAIHKKGSLLDCRTYLRASLNSGWESLGNKKDIDKYVNDLAYDYTTILRVEVKYLTKELSKDMGVTTQGLCKHLEDKYKFKAHDTSNLRNENSQTAKIKIYFPYDFFNNCTAAQSLDNELGGDGYDDVYTETRWVLRVNREKYAQYKKLNGKHKGKKS
jgi:hypothetical protein